MLSDCEWPYPGALCEAPGICHERQESEDTSLRFCGQKLGPAWRSTEYLHGSGAATLTESREQANVSAQFPIGRGCRLGMRMLRRSVWRRASGVLLALIWMIGAANARDAVETERPSQDDVEAAYLYNFGKFVRWPQMAAQGPLTICVADRDSVSQDIARLVAGETIEGRALQVRTPTRADGVGGCSILFIGTPEGNRVSAYLSAASGKPVLTVSDAPDFLTRGGMIQFVLVEDHVRFSVNLLAVTHSNLQLSSELLKVAMRVQGQPGMGGSQ